MSHVGRCPLAGPPQVLDLHGWMIGILTWVMLNNSILLQCLSSRKCTRRSQSCGMHLFLPETALLPPLLSLPLMVGWPKGTCRSPRWNMQLQCSYARKMLPPICVIHFSYPRPVGLMVLLDRPCMPWLSCKCIKPWQ